MIFTSQVQTDDGFIVYRHAGDGPALVLLHGFLCDSRCWRHQLLELSDSFTVIAWDAPGAGLSSNPPESFRLADWSRRLAEFLDALRVSRAQLVGLSWGGVLAQDFYRTHADRVSRLVLADTYAGWKGSFPAAVVEQRLSRCERDSLLVPGEFVTRWVPEMFSAAAPRSALEEMAAVFADFHPLGFRLMAKSLADTDTRDVLPTIACPTLLLWGEQDSRSPVAVAQQMHSQLREAELCLIPRAGHVSNMEQPGVFNTHIRRFCGAQPER